MAIKLGSTGINRLYLGSTQINRIYLGNTIVFGSSGVLFEITSHEVSEITDTSFKLRCYMTKQCKISYWVNGVLNAASNDDYNAGEPEPGVFRHTRTLTGVPSGILNDVVVQITAQDNGEVYTYPTFQVQTTGISNEILKPIMTNFNITNADKTYINFDTPLGYPDGIVASDFKVQGKTVSSVTKISDVGGYFTLSAPLTYWDNILIRKEANNSVGCHDFTLQYINNTINEESITGTEWDTTDATELTTAMSSAVAGDTIWIKEGTYSGTFTLSNSGTVTNPIKIIGYKTTHGDGSSYMPTRAPDLNADANELPLINGKFVATNDQYVIFKNLQVNVPNGAQEVGFAMNSYQVYENCYTWTGDYGFRANNNSHTSIRLIDCYAKDMTNSGVRLYNKHHLIDNFYACTSGAVSMDYYISLYGGTDGHSQCVRNSTADRNINATHTGHGIGFKGSGGILEHSLVENCSINNCGNGGFEFRHSTIKYNIGRNITIDSDTKGVNNRAIMFRDGTSFNRVENSHVNNAEYSVRFLDSTEDGGLNQNGGSDNTVINTIFSNADTSFINVDGGVTLPNERNKFINCTFDNAPDFYKSGTTPDYFDSSNEFINCIVNDCNDKIGSGQGSFIFTNSLFYNGFTGEGTGAITGIDPQLDASYQPQATFTDIDVERSIDALYDYNSSERTNPTTVGSIKHDNEAIEVPVSGLKPLMTNFRFGDSNKDRIYFDTPLGSVDGISHTDFVIDNVTINSVNTTSNYFTLSADLTYFSQILIRKDGGNNDVVNDFLVQRITNNISEPTPTETKYASMSGSGSKSGADEANAWDITQIQNGVSAGTKVMLLNGAYTSYLELGGADGSATKPIWIEGYNNNAKDVLRTRTYGMTFDSTIMPLFDGQGIKLNKKDYYILKNIQIEGATQGYGIEIARTFGSRIENCYIKGGSHSIYNFDPILGSNSKVVRCYTQDPYQSCVRLRNGNNLVEDTWAVTTLQTANNGTDYYISINGGEVGTNNAVLDNYIRRFPTMAHNGHGVSFKANADDEPTSVIEYSLAEGNHIIDNRGGVEFRHSQTRYCVGRNNLMEGINESVKVIGTHFRDGASYNTFERNLVKNGNMGVRFHNAGEDASADGAKGGFNNTVRNNVFDTMLNFVTADSGTSSNDNDFYNNTLLNVDDISTVTTTFTGNIFKNNIVEGGLTTGEDGTWKNTVFWNNSFASYGDTYVDVNPDLNASYEPQAAFASIQFGKIGTVLDDYNGNERADLTTAGSVKHDDEVVEVPVIPDFYVALSGDNSDGLTEATAWNSLASLQSEIGPALDNSIVGFKGGDEFEGNINFEQRNGITFTSYGTGQATLKGSTGMTGWTNTSGNIWECSDGGNTIYNVYKNNIPVSNARTPSWSDATGEDDPLTYHHVDSVQNTSTQFTDAALIGSGDLVGATVWMTMNPHTRSKQTISAFNNSTGQVTLTADINATYNIVVGGEYWIQNAYDLLTTQDEWFYDSTANKLYMYSTSSPTGISACVNSDIGFYMKYSTNTLDNLIIRDYANYGVQFHSSAGTLSNCNLEGCIGNALYNLSGDDSVYKNNHFKNNVGTAIQLVNADDNLVEDNVIENQWLVKNYLPTSGSSGSGIYMSYHSLRPVVRYNKLLNCGFNGIYSAGSKDFDVDMNYLENCGLSLQDGAAIYVYNKLGDGSAGTVTNNIVKHYDYIESDRDFHGIYNDDDAHDITVQDNVTIGGKWGAYSHNNINMVYSGNSFYLSGVGSVYLKNDTIGQTYANIEVSQNDMFKNDATPNLYITNNDGADYSMLTSDNNNYWNIGDTEVVRLNVTGDSSDNTLAQWRTKSSQDANSTDDSAVTVTDHQCVYNNTKVVSSVSLTGTWYGLDGTPYTSSIILQPFTGKILYSIT